MKPSIFIFLLLLLSMPSSRAVDTDHGIVNYPDDRLVLFVLVDSATSISGVENLPQIGMEVNILLTDGFQRITEDLKGRFSQFKNIPKAEVNRVIPIIEEYSNRILEQNKGIIADSFQQMLAVGELSNRYGIVKSPAILLVDGRSKYKLIYNQTDIGAGFVILNEQSYETL